MAGKDMSKSTNQLKQKPSDAITARIFAGIIDVILWGVLFFIAAKAFGTTTTTGYGSAASTNVSLSGTPFVIFLLVALAYFVLLEWRLGGTIGKLLLGVRVVGENGGRVTFRQSAIRNVFRVIDAVPYVIPYVVGLVFVASDDSKRRLGDRTANTRVILKSGRTAANDWSIIS